MVMVLSLNSKEEEISLKEEEEKVYKRTQVLENQPYHICSPFLYKL